MSQRLKDKVAIVTGAGSIGPGWGNGKASAVQLAREGARVLCVDVNAEAAEETAATIAGEGGRAASFSADVTDEAAVAAMAADCVARWGGIDILHHNVGIVRVGGPAELSLEDWDRVLAVNLTSAFLTCRHVLPVMEGQGNGSIVATGSIAAIRYTGVPYCSYNATKAALMGLMQSVAIQYAGRGIRANTVLPGLMDTPMIYHGLPDAYAEGDVEKMRAMRRGQVPTGEMGDAWDVARAVLYLASDEARYVTATNLVVDGGITAQYTTQSWR